MSVTFEEESRRGYGKGQAGDRGNDENLCVNLMIFFNIQHIDFYCIKVL